eukprot:4130352-Prymnesium_polylepis.1
MTRCPFFGVAAPRCRAATSRRGPAPCACPCAPCDARDRGSFAPRSDPLVCDTEKFLRRESVGVRKCQA